VRKDFGIAGSMCMANGNSAIPKSLRTYAFEILPHLTSSPFAFTANITRQKKKKQYFTWQQYDMIDEQTCF
jgi:hypothetical protein